MQTTKRTMQAEDDDNDAESKPFGAHKTTTLGDIDDDIGHAVFVSWISVAATFAGVAIVGLLVKPKTPLLSMVSDFFLAISIAIVMWAMFVFFGFRKRHWTTWILFVILLFAVVSMFILAFV